MIMCKYMIMTAVQRLPIKSTKIQRTDRNILTKKLVQLSFQQKLEKYAISNEVPQAVSFKKRYLNVGRNLFGKICTKIYKQKSTIVNLECGSLFCSGRTPKRRTAIN